MPYAPCVVTYLSLLERKRVTVVPHTGHGPLAIRRPVAVSSTLPSFTCRFSRHLTQYPSNSILALLSFSGKTFRLPHTAGPERSPAAVFALKASDAMGWRGKGKLAVVRDTPAQRCKPSAPINRVFISQNQRRTQVDRSIKNRLGNEPSVHWTSDQVMDPVAVQRGIPHLSNACHRRTCYDRLGCSALGFC